jgi:hypothetical protein
MASKNSSVIKIIFFIESIFHLSTTIILLRPTKVYGKEYTCTHGFKDFHLWPWSHFCRANNVDLSAANKQEIYTFGGSGWERRSEISIIKFDNCPRTVDFIPISITQTFENLNGISIKDSNLPIIKVGLFNENFKRLVFINLENNNLEKIEDKALNELTDLQWFNIYRNKLTYLKYNIFENNPKLKHISFTYNLLKTISPLLFENLKNLEHLGLSNNDCVSKTFGSCGHCDDDLSMVNKKLKYCHNNCWSDSECVCKHPSQNSIYKGRFFNNN